MMRLLKGPMAMMLWCVLLPAAQGTAQPLTVVTFNIRYDTPRDSPNHWQARRQHVVAQVRFHEADILGVQEALHRQVLYLQQALPGYGFVGVGRDDGKAAGEYSGIFYHQQKLQLQDSGHFWLSLTPEVPGSKSWDAAYTRIVSWAKFRHRQSGRIFYHFNTHFDHSGQEARRQSAGLLLQRVAAIAGKHPVLVTGDFNATPDSEPIMLITDMANPLHLTDSRALSASPHYGPQGTFNGFGSRETADAPIDYIFVRGPWQVHKHATLSQTWGGLFASDHFAVLARVQLR